MVILSRKVINENSNHTDRTKQNVQQKSITQQQFQTRLYEIMYSLCSFNRFIRKKKLKILFYFLSGEPTSTHPALALFYDSPTLDC